MAFYTQPLDSTLKDPKRKFRWKVKINTMDDSGCIWWAKTVAKPNFEISESEHTFLTHKFYYPGRITWGEIEMTLIDPVNPGAVATLNAAIRATGYHVPAVDLRAGDPNLADAAFETMSKGKGVDALGSVIIQQLNADGGVTEEWELQNPWIKGVKYGDLDYSSDDLLEISLTLRYDWAVCRIGSAVAAGGDANAPGADNSYNPPNGVFSNVPDKTFFTAGDDE